MLYLAFALYYEAAPYIRAFSAKRETSFTKDQVFTNLNLFAEETPDLPFVTNPPPSSDDNSEAANLLPVMIIITGSGPVPAAASLSRVLACYPPSEEDIFANIGSCGCPDGSVTIGRTIMIHRLIEAASGRNFYPDMLYVHSFPEGALTTVSAPQRESSVSGMLYDMEGAALYQAALPFFSTDRMFFFKTVSDFGSLDDLSPSDLLEQAMESLNPIRTTLEGFASTQIRAQHYSETEEAVIEEFCALLYASESMRQEIRRLITYYELERGYAIALLHDFIAEHELRGETAPRLRSRKEGKVYLERFRETCLQ